MRRMLLPLLLIIPLHAHAAGPPDAALCGEAIGRWENLAHLPQRMLAAIGVVESGRIDPQSRRVEPWPWSINVAGVDHVFENAADAIAAVRSAQRAGVQSIDVGCMQINLLHHPSAFNSLEEAFDPAANVAYATAFLLQLKAQTGSWGPAVAAYHSSTPAIGAVYSRRIALVWPLASHYGLPLPVPQAAPVVPQGLAVDPFNVMTPEFRAKLIADAAFKAQRNTALGLRAPPVAQSPQPARPRIETMRYPIEQRRIQQASLGG